jgi:hypothetical protein
MKLYTKQYQPNWILAYGKDLHGRYISGQGRTVQEAIINALTS